MVSVSGGAPGRSFDLTDRIRPIRLPVGVSARLPRGTPAFVLNDPPQGLKIAELPAHGSTRDLSIEAGPDAVAGTAGNLIVDIMFTPQSGVGVRGKAGAPAPSRAPRQMRIGTLPAIPFEIVDR